MSDWPCGCKIEYHGDLCLAITYCQLHSAAPDLLEACEAVCKSLGIRRDFAPIGTMDFGTKLLDAIAKAKGQ